MMILFLSSKIENVTFEQLKLLIDKFHLAMDLSKNKTHRNFNLINLYIQNRNKINEFIDLLNEHAVASQVVDINLMEYKEWRELEKNNVLPNDKEIELNNNQIIVESKNEEIILNTLPDKNMDSKLNNFEKSSLLHSSIFNQKRKRANEIAVDDYYSKRTKYEFSENLGNIIYSFCEPKVEIKFNYTSFLSMQVENISFFSDIISSLIEKLISLNFKITSRSNNFGIQSIEFAPEIAYLLPLLQSSFNELMNIFKKLDNDKISITDLKNRLFKQYEIEEKPQITNNSTKQIDELKVKLYQQFIESKIILYSDDSNLLSTPKLG